MRCGRPECYIEDDHLHGTSTGGQLVNNFDNENYHKNILEERAANEPPHSPLPGKNVCKHGSLARSCEICELETENKVLREKICEHINDKNDLRETNADLVKALEEAVSLITFEYCGHDGPHSPDLKGCAARKQLEALRRAGGVE